MTDIADRIRALTRKPESGGPTNARTNRTNSPEGPPQGISAICARGSVLSQDQDPGWTEDALYVYLERLGVAEEQGLDTAPGSRAEATARREARRVMAGLPPSWSGTRGPTSLDAVIDVFDGARFAGFIDASEIAPVWPETDASRRASNGGHASVDHLHAPTQSEVEP